MILDPRIKAGKRPLTCLDVDQAREFEGKKCFMASGLSYFNDLSRFEDIQPFNFSMGKLMVIDDLTDNVFYNADTKLSYRCVLPCEWVKQKSEINFEPYTLDTWQHEFEPGEVIIFRGKNGSPKDNIYYECIYNGYLKTKEGKIIIILGPFMFPFDELFAFHEINRVGTWEPFGRKVENIDICAGA